MVGSRTLPAGSLAWLGGLEDKPNGLTKTVLGGSWIVISGAMSPLILVITTLTLVTLVTTPRIIAQEPPSREDSGVAGSTRNPKVWRTIACDGLGFRVQVVSVLGHDFTYFWGSRQVFWAQSDALLPARRSSKRANDSPIPMEDPRDSNIP